MCVCVNTESLTWVGPSSSPEIQAHFASIFARARVCHGDVFFCASRGDVVDDLKRCLRAQGRFLQPGTDVMDMLAEGTQFCLKQCAASGRRAIWREYEAKRVEDLRDEGRFLAEIAKHEAHSRGGECWPVLLTGCQHIYSCAHKRFACLVDAFACMGHAAHSAADPFESDILQLWREGVVPHAQVCRMVGNSMSLPALGAWLTYVLGKVVPVETASPMSTLERAMLERQRWQHAEPAPCEQRRGAIEVHFAG